MDYFFIGELIRERLSAEMPELRAVYGAAEYSRVESFDPVAPCAFVIYHSDGVSMTPAATGGHQRRAQFVQQRWMVVLCVDFADPHNLGDRLQKVAGEHISDLIKALAGWSADQKRATPLQRSSITVSADYSDGRGYFPFVFEAGIPAALGGFK